MPKRLTREIVNNRLKAKKIIMVGEYVNVDFKTNFKCSMGHIWAATPYSVMFLSGCPECSGMKPLTIDIVNSKIKNRGLEMISPYKNNKSKAIFRCSLGHTWKATPKWVIRETGCPWCAGNKPLDMNEINKRIKDRGFVLVGGYKSTNEKADFFCPNNHFFLARVADIMRGGGCQKCSGLKPLTEKVVSKRIRGRGITIISKFKSASSKTKFMCSLGHVWATTPHHVARGGGCPECYGNIPLTKEIINKRLSSRGFRLVGAYKSNNKKTKFECPKKHKWDARPGNILSGSGCPVCSVHGFNSCAPAIFYYLEITSKYGTFYKVGITNRGIDKRFLRHEMSKIRILKIMKFKKGNEAAKLERSVLKRFKDHRYKGVSILSSGNTELFTKDVLNLSK